MTQFLVFQIPPTVEEGMELPGPRLFMAGLTEADSAQAAVHDVVNSGNFPSGGPLGVLDASDVTMFDVALSAKVSKSA